MVVVFFFQAEDGIRDLTVTGVQTCALPISAASSQGDRDAVMSVALTNGRVLLEDGLAEKRCVLLSGGRILDIVAPSDRRVRRAERYDLRGQLLLPGFIDSQVNGGGGGLFYDPPSVESIRAIGRAHRRFGTTGFLPTLISADLDVVARAIAAVCSAIEAGVPGEIGRASCRERV